jgi:hypothetical protein
MCAALGWLVDHFRGDHEQLEAENRRLRAGQATKLER